MPFFVLLVVNICIGTLGASSMFSLLNASVEDLEKFPFGTEHGYAYSSRETYLAVHLLWTFIFIQSVLVSIYLSRISKKHVSLIVLTLPFVLWAIFGFLGLNIPDMIQ